MSNFNHIPRKRFGQHFLHDVGVLENMVNDIHPQKIDHMVEVGPGPGVLTEYLIPAVARLDAIEIDRDLVAYLKEKFTQPNFFLYEKDVLHFDFKQLSQTPHSLRIVGNLPYNISTPLLFKLFEVNDLIQDMHFMLQKEVAERLAAQIGDANYGRLSIMTQYHCQTEILMYVAPESFDPPPKVDSAIIRLTPKPATLTAIELKRLELIIQTAFNQRRKTMHNSLKNLINADQFAQAEIDPSRRPQELSVEEFIRLARISLRAT